MGYGVYFRDGRWGGYMVPAICDADGCEVKIDRGLYFMCEEHVESELIYDQHQDEYYEAEHTSPGCELFFCTEHRYNAAEHVFAIPKGEHPEWMFWQLHHSSWAEWREENPNTVEHYKTLLDGYEPKESLLAELKEDDGTS